MNIRIQLVAGLLWAGLAVAAWAEPGEGRERGGENPKRDYFGHMLRGLDKDGDGSISFAEFAAGGRVSRLPEEHQRRLFDRLDKNGDGQIRRNEIPREAGKIVPWQFDADKNGKVTFEEFRKNPRVAKLPEERQQEIFDRMDRNGDGVLSPRDGGGRLPGGKVPPSPLASLDTDGNDSISLEEFQSNPRLKDQPVEARNKAFRKLDRDGSGELERKEWFSPRPRGDRGPRVEKKKPGRGERERTPRE
jgi:Ca2+-binding EF-hand superfamily protein